MKIKSAYGWAIAIPVWEPGSDLWLSLRVFSTRQEAIRYECWNQNLATSYAVPGSLSPWTRIRGGSAEVSKAWKKLYR